MIGQWAGSRYQFELRQGPFHSRKLTATRSLQRIEIRCPEPYAEHSTGVAIYSRPDITQSWPFYLTYQGTQFKDSENAYEIGEIEE